MVSSRIINTRRNIIASYVSMALKYIFTFVSRSAIVHTLGSEYLGLSSLVMSVIQVLSVAELGFTGSVVYNLYKPIADNDEEAVCAILAFFKNVYRAIGFTIIGAGLLLTPFLPRLIHGTVPVGINLYVIYILYLIDTGLSYLLFAYQQALLTAAQRLDLTKVTSMIVCAIQYTIQLIALYLCRNFYLFVLCQLIGTALNNIITALVTRRVFPQYYCRGTISREVRKDIVTRVRGLLVARISTMTYTTFDGVILSAMLGLRSVAIYSNYSTVQSAVASLVGALRSAMDASVGNSVASESVKKNFNDLQTWQLLFSLLATWSTSCFVCLLQPFMVLWMGEDMLLPFRDVILLAALLSVNIVQHSYFLFLNGNGMWWEMRWAYTCSTVANIIMNVSLGAIFGVTGVILSTLIATTVFGFIWQAQIIFKEYFHERIAPFYRRQTLYFIIEIISVGLSYCCCSAFTYEGILGFLLKGVVATLVPIPVTLIAYAGNPAFKRIISLSKATLDRKTS